MIMEGLTAVHEHYRNFLSETCERCRIIKHVHLPPLKPVFRLKPPKLILDFITEAAARLRIYNDLVFQSQ